MPSFRYEALTRGGELQQGVKEGASQSAVMNELRQQGAWPVYVEETTSGAQTEFKRARSNELSQSQLTAFFFGLSTLLSAGLSLERALMVLNQAKGRKAITVVTGAVLKQVRGGASLSQALSHAVGVPRLAIAMVRAGEAGGTLRDTLERLAAMMQRSAVIRSEILSALIYPCILLATSGLTISVIMIFVVPEFEPLFAASNRPPPVAFRVLAELSHILRVGAWSVPLLGGCAWLGFSKLPHGHFHFRWWHTLKLRLPVVGPLTREIEIERLCSVLGTLIQNGVEVPVALGLAAESISNLEISSSVSAAVKGLREGGRLAERLARTGQFPSSVLDMIRMGEEAGRLSEILLHQAGMLQQSIQNQTSRLLAMMVPAITLLLGCVVAGIVMSLLGAILSVNNLAQQ